MKKLSLLLALIMVLGCVFTVFTACNKDDDKNNDDGDKQSGDKTTTEKISMVCLGDSITYGQDGDPDLTEPARMKKPYPTIIKNQLRYDVDNIAVPGATIRTGVKRADNTTRPTIQDQLDLIEGTPDIISIMGGVNDCGNFVLGENTPSNKDTANFYGALRKMCGELKTNYPDAYIFFITPLRTATYSDPAADSTLKTICEAIKTVCAEYEFPVYDAFAEIEIDFEDPKTSSDGVHIAADVIEDVVAPKIVKFIKDNYKAE